MAKVFLALVSADRKILGQAVDGEHRVDPKVIDLRDISVHAANQSNDRHLLCPRALGNASIPPARQITRRSAVAPAAAKKLKTYTPMPPRPCFPSRTT